LLTQSGGLITTRLWAGRGDGYVYDRRR